MRSLAWCLLPVALSAGGAGGANDTDDLERLMEIGDQELRIIVDPPTDKPLPDQRKHLSITRQSLDDGWVASRQCHGQLNWWGDAVQIVFGRNTVRGLEITRATGIEKSWVEGSTVQLEGIAPHGEVCLKSVNRVFHPGKPGEDDLLRIGPFKFQLFDGFFPTKIRLRVDYPKELLRYKGTKPAPAEGVFVQATPGQVLFETVFEGVLWIEMRFSRLAE